VFDSQNVHRASYTFAQRVYCSLMGRVSRWREAKRNASRLRVPLT